MNAPAKHHRPRRRHPALHRRRAEPGVAPGTINVDPDAPQPRIDVIAYNAESVTERTLDDPAELHALLRTHTVTWVNVTGLGDARFLHQIAEAFSLHRLALEDVVNTHQRPKVEEYPDHLFIVARIPQTGETDAHGADSEQVTLFLGAGYVLTFQEIAGDCFDRVRGRIRGGGGRMRTAGADYLAYALLDAVTDAWFAPLEHYGEVIEDLEAMAMNGATRQHLIGDIHDVKRDLLTLRRTVWPLREVFGALIRDDSDLIDPQTRIYLRDCYDHAVQLMDIVETDREIASGLVDIFHSSLSMHMNEIMKVLTMIATIFIPLSFIAGIYGMNFDPDASPWNMPELNWYLGYPFALGMMAALATTMLWVFWRKRWIGASLRGKRSGRSDTD